MKLVDYNFRELYKQLVIVKGDKASAAARQMLAENGYIPSSLMDAVLCYCYIDIEAGMSFEYLCFIDSDRKKADIASYEQLIIKKQRLFYRYNTIRDYEVEIYRGDVTAFQERCLMIDTSYNNDKKVAVTRDIEIIDELRFPVNPDDISVLLLKKELQTELVWVRMTGIEDGKIVGTLLNEPNSDFGIHYSDKISVDIIKQEDRIIAYCAF